jgi:hypothetical protein
MEITASVAPYLRASVIDLSGLMEFATLNRHEVQELLDAAEAQADPPFVGTGGGKLISRSICEKQRSRR